MMHDMTVCLVLLNCFDEINQTSYVLTSVFVRKYPSAACARKLNFCFKGFEDFSLCGPQSVYKFCIGCFVFSERGILIITKTFLPYA